MRLIGVIALAAPALAGVLRASIADVIQRDVVDVAKAGLSAIEAAIERKAPVAERATCTTVDVTFAELVTTQWGESVSIVGSISQLGTWNTSMGVALSASQYTSSNPLWAVTISLPAGTAFQYKYIKFATDGTVNWEADPNHSYTVPSSCSSAYTESDTWQVLTTATASPTSAVTLQSTIATATPTSSSASTTKASTTTAARSVSSSSGKTTSSSTGKTTSSSSVKSSSTTSAKTSSTTGKTSSSSTGKTSSSSTNKTTSTVSGKASSTTNSSATSTATCTNSPTTRNCWTSGFSIDTDFDDNWPITGNTVTYNLDITNTTLSPDGYERIVLAVNGQYPGPTIYANWGDVIHVTVNNKLQDNGTAIHFHGLRQYHSNTHDGVPGITECPLAPGQSKTYVFQATQYGTSWYHSHFSSQYGDGVLGPIVINGPSTANYDIDLGPLPITDWYYPTVAVHASLAMHSNALPPEADNGLINGSMISSYGGQHSISNLTAGKTHLVRLINTAVDNHFVVQLDGHVMTVISADFVPTVPYNVTTLFIGIGQRYDVLITANQAPGAYWFRADVQDTAGCGSNFNNGNIKSVFAYAGHSTETPISTAYSYTQTCADQTGLESYWNSYVPTGQIQTLTELTASLNQTTGPDDSLTLYWNINGSTFNVDWNNPLLGDVKDGVTNYSSRENVINLPTEGIWTYWVIQSVAGYPYDVEVPHPIHLHGHDFYVLGTGTSPWTVADAKSLNYNNPLRRDVAMLEPYGWLALAFQTDNPGAWLMHCHIAWHGDEGFAVQFLEAPGSIEELPSDYASQCAAWEEYAKNPAYPKGDSGI